MRGQDHGDRVDDNQIRAHECERAASDAFRRMTRIPQAEWSIHMGGSLRLTSERIRVPCEDAARNGCGVVAFDYDQTPWSRNPTARTSTSRSWMPVRPNFSCNPVRRLDTFQHMKTTLKGSNGSWRNPAHCPTARIGLAHVAVRQSAFRGHCSRSPVEQGRGTARPVLEWFSRVTGSRQ